MIIKNKNSSINLLSLNRPINKNDINSVIILPENYLNYNNSTILEKEYKYFSTCVLITNTNNMYNLIDYIFWHLYICNFEHLLIISNNNKNNINEINQIIKLFDTNRISFIENNSPLYEIHNLILKTFPSKYIMFIDDDEYLYIPDKYKDINLLLKEKENDNIFKFSINWIHFFNNVLIKDFDNKISSCINVFKYYYQKINFKEIRFNLIKTIYKTNLNHYVFSDNSSHVRLLTNIYLKTSTWNEVKPGTLHNALTILNNTLIPTHNLTNLTLNYNYDNSSIDDIIINDNVFLAHYKYTSLNSIYDKLNKTRDLISIDPESYKYNYNEQLIMDLYSSLDSSNCKYFSLLDDRYNIFKNDILKLKSKI